MSLRAVSFHWKGKENEEQKIGLIAQEVDDVIKEVVTKGDNELQTLGINYSNIIPVLIKGMQEQQSTIRQHQSTINQQQKIIDDLLKRIKKIENK